jgi:hypothetical protein
MFGEHPQHERGRDLVREVRDHAGGPAAEDPIEISRQRVAPDEPDRVQPADDLGQSRLQRAVLLYRDDRRAGGGQTSRERTHTGADLDDQLAG